MMKNIALIILNWNGTDDTIECLESLEWCELYDIFVLDNGSKDEERQKLLDYAQSGKYNKDFIVNKTITGALEEIGTLKIITLENNLGFAGGNNYIAEAVCHDYEFIMLLNNDTEVTDGAIENMLACIRSNSYIAISCDIRNYYKKNTLWNAGGKFTFYGDRKYYSQKKIDDLKKKKITNIQVDFITGCAMLIDASYVIEHGLFTRRFFHGEEDFNFCLKAKKRHGRIGVDLEAVIYHKIGRTLKHNSSDEQRVFNAMVLHYSNRIIDYKEFYPKVIWMLWREFYLLLIFIKRMVEERKIKKIFLLLKQVKKITSCNNEIDKRTFDEIMQFDCRRI